MKSIIILASFIGLTTTVFGQNIIKTLSQFEIKQNGKTLVGLKNLDGKIIIPAKYLGIIIEDPILSKMMLLTFKALWNQGDKV